MSAQRYLRSPVGTVTVAYSDHEAKMLAHQGWAKVQVVPLDAIVIRREELPEVKAGQVAWVSSTGPDWPIDTDPAAIELRAIEHLAIAEYLRANPPVDPRVEALADIFREAKTRGDFDFYAASLISSGRVRIGGGSDV